MRLPLAATLLALTVAAGLLQSVAAGTALAGAAPARVPRTARTWNLRLAPAPDDFALAQIRFPRAGRRAVARDLAHIEMQAPFGDDYLAVAMAGAGVAAGGAQSFVLLINRPSALEDPASVELRLRASGPLAEHEVRTVENPFAQPAASTAPHGFCDLATRGHALQTRELTPLRSVGAPLDGSGAGAPLDGSGSGAAAAVAQAYDVACGLAYESAFKRAVTGTSTQPQPAPPQPAPVPQPQPAPPAPAPTPPVGQLPGEGCVPAPGYACPAALASRSSIATLDTAQRAATGA